MSEELLRRWAQVERILDAVLELDDEAGRAEYLQRACAGDPGLRRAVERLLRADREAAQFLEHPVTLDADPAGPDRSASAKPVLPRRIGPFRVVREVGRGGMSTVLLGERDDGQFVQRVAIKSIHAGEWSEAGSRRFLRERQILARLEHPHIARLVDGGVDEHGMPYFAMELVEGRPIVESCDARRLDLRQRLRLFLQVCDAVEYAHRQLVVHRDLKPGNILVTAEDQIKLLDFGIAKLLDEGAEDLTHGVSRVLTPAYAAPEQFRGDPVTVTTDVYALGLVLYELLTGRRGHRVESPSPLALQRAALETDPERPSRAVAASSGSTDRTSTETRDAIVARDRSTTPRQLRQALEGDLDAIVLQALRKEPEARYASVEALRRDIEAFLDNRPVGARRGTWAYRVRKYARRHRIEVTAAAAVVLSLLGGLLGIASQSRAAAHERDVARAAEHRATAIHEFVLNELLQAATPEMALGHPASVAEVLDTASRSIEHAFPQQPETEAAVRVTLARAYRSLGRFGEADRQASRARERLERRLGSRAPETLRARTLQAEVLADLGRHEEARAEIERVLDEQRRRLGPTHEDTLETRSALARMRLLEGRFAAAEAELRDALLVIERHHPENWRLAALVRARLVDALLGRHAGADAEAICRKLLERQREHLGPEHPEVATTLLRLARALSKQLRYDDAGSVVQQVVDMRSRLLGPEHPATADALVDLAVLADHRSAYDEAVSLFRRAHAIYADRLGAEHPSALRTLSNIGVIHRLAGRLDEAEPIYRQVYEIRRRTLGESDPQTLAALRHINILLVAAGRVGEARDVARQVVERYEDVIADPEADPIAINDFADFLLTVEPEDVRDAGRALHLSMRAVDATQRGQFLLLRTLGMAQRQLGRHDEAVATLREALAHDEAVRSWTTESMLVDWLREDGDASTAESFLLDNLARRRALRGDDDPLIGKTLRLLGLLCLEQRRDDEAERWLGQAEAQYVRSLPAGYWEIGRAKSELGERLVARGAFEEGEVRLLEGFEILSGDPRVRPVYRDQARQRLVRLYEAWGKPDRAEAWRAGSPR